MPHYAVSMKQPASLEHQLHPSLQARYSPRAFDGKPLASGALRQLLEAARWAASCFNEQPWRFIVAERQDDAAFQTALQCLVPFNQGWAKHASALILTVAKTSFSHNDKPNPHAWHDIGLAIGALTAQAQALGISLHQMAGVDFDKARSSYHVPDGYEVVTAVALGHPGPLEVLSADLQKQETAARERRSQHEVVFGGRFGEAAVLQGEEDIERVLSLWFGELNEQGLADKAHNKQWYSKDPAFDQMLRDQFAGLHLQILGGQCDHWLTSARGALAAVIVLDQFSRNMYRETPGMYAADARALAIAEQTIANQLDLSLATAERVFLYMPFMHAETLAAQERCIALMSGLRDVVTGDAEKGLSQNVLYAEKHRDIVRGYGRFPHRNSILGRPSSEAETVFLTQPGSSF